MWGNQSRNSSSNMPRSQIILQANAGNEGEEGKDSSQAGLGIKIIEGLQPPTKLVSKPFNVTRGMFADDQRANKKAELFDASKVVR